MTKLFETPRYVVSDDCKSDYGGWYPAAFIENKQTGESYPIAYRDGSAFATGDEARKAIEQHVKALIRTGHLS